MEKKKYVAPQITEVFLTEKVTILAGSGVEGNGMGYGGEGADGDEIGSRRRRGGFIDDDY
ncbi:MAG: hypothetical protein IJ841_03595 [Prevotella sp.]|nr:hypothetical protein [Prevotella sp.]